MTRLFDRLSDFQLSNSLALKAMIDQIESQVETQYDQISAIDASQNAQLAQIEALLDPNTLTPSDKPIWIFMAYSIVNEKADLDAKATTYGITTEKTNYDNSYNTLIAYLGTRTSPTNWDDTAGNTTINATTWRNDFIDVLYRKQLLINAITAKAKVLADAAQSTANTAQSTATTAQSTATTAQSTATTAQSTATTAQSTATTAQSTATSSYREAARINSYANPGVGILSASDTGSSCKISVAAHTRVYPVEGGIDVPDVSIAANASAVTGLAYSTTYFVYYDDTSLSDTTPNFQATTSSATAQVGAAAGRHNVGFVTTPAAGGGSTSGTGPAPPGGGGGGGLGAIP